MSLASNQSRFVYGGVSLNARILNSNQALSNPNGRSINARQVLSGVGGSDGGASGGASGGAGGGGASGGGSGSGGGPVTYLYQKVGPNGEHLKFGITKNPETRYTSSQLGGGELRIIASGNRKEMLGLERNIHETLPIGPEEGQNFYINKQVNKGYMPPPYK